MTLNPIKDFQHFTTHHCVTGSMRHVYVHNQHEVSEDMLLGLGGGVGFIYWHMKGTAPFMGGRGKGRPGHGFETCAGIRTGVMIEEHTTTSASKAEKSLLEQLDAGHPVMVQCDMGFLPYFDFGGYEYHFGAHVVVVCGYDPETRQVLIADREEALHPIPMDDLAKARGSTHKPFPPKHRWYTFDFSGKRAPTSDEVRQAIAEQVKEMLSPPISNLGVKGIRKAAKQVLNWPQLMDEETLRATLFNAFVFIDAMGGTGGGAFRYMFSRFLGEAAEITEDPRLKQSADAFQYIGDRWQEAAEIFKRGWDAEDPVAVLSEIPLPLHAIADLEEAAWKRLGNWSEIDVFS
jgi:hypothetical protein